MSDGSERSTAALAEESAQQTWEECERLCCTRDPEAVLTLYLRAVEALDARLRDALRRHRWERERRGAL